MGTDCATIAQSTGWQPVLLPSFLAAINFALKEKTYLLLPAGMMEQQGGVAIGWVDFHYSMNGHIKLMRVWSEPTLPMVFVYRGSRAIALHPATAALIPPGYQFESHVVTASKVAALELLRQDAVTAAIVTQTAAEDFCGATVIPLEPTMVWLLYDCTAAPVDSFAPSPALRAVRTGAKDTAAAAQS